MPVKEYLNARDLHATFSAWPVSSEKAPCKQGLGMIQV